MNKPVTPSILRNRAPSYGAIDLGTNNCRLLVAVPNAQSFDVVGSFSRIVRLGENLSLSGKLSDEAMTRTIDALKTCATIMQANGVKSYQAISTEACRRASNGLDFIARITAETGIVMNTIGSQREAELTFKGCCSLLDDDKPHGLVVDIGGGSTELMWIEQANMASAHVASYQSIPEGVVTLADKYGATMTGQDGYENLIAMITPWLDEFDNKCDISRATASGNLTILGTSGTVTTLGALHLGLKRYDRSRIDGMVIDFQSITTISRWLASMTCETRAHHPCIGQERSDLMVMGCALLEAIIRRWNVGRLRVADRGIREGLLLESMAMDGYEVPQSCGKKSIVS
jgi:exopolyphosphatase/guanosine-5'-triphosphate,3'-diphosphate pyrophosphatase